MLDSSEGEDRLEAVRRIEEARASEVETLDLRNLDLVEVPLQVGELRHLKELLLGREKGAGPDELLFDLRGLIGLEELERLDLIGCSSLTDLSPLSGLTQLQQLDLEWCRSLTDLSPLSGLTQLQQLDLTGCISLKDLSPLSGLTQLQQLDLGWCISLKDLSPLSGVTQLQQLGLGWCDSLTDLSPLSGLMDLQQLTVRGCSSLTDLSPLSGLTELQQLDIGGCRSLTDLSPLSGLTDLQQLDIGGCGSLTDLSPLSGLTELQYLDVGWCSSLTDLSPLSGLTDLQQLDVRGCGSVTDLSPLSGLTDLQQLNVRGCGSVTDLSPLSGLQQLSKLDLAFCKKVTSFLPLEHLKQLRELDLDHCVGLDDLSFLHGMNQLTRLSMFEVGVTLNDIRDLLDTLSDLREIIASNIGGIPREVQSQHAEDDCLPSLISYLTELQHGAEGENDVKIFVLGNGRVGKTQLCRRLRGEPFDEEIPSTHGVEVWRTNLTVGGDDDALTCTVNWWDFGGQDVYHGTHALFLRSRAVFLVLWNPELENREEVEEDGVPVRNQPLAYWLDYVRSLAGNEVPVVVVQSRCDDFGQEAPLPVSNPGFAFWRPCVFGAKEDFGRETLEAQVKDAVRFLWSRSGPLLIGRGRAELRRWLYQLQDEDRVRPVEQRVDRTLTVERFQKLCEKVGDIANWEHALDYLHQTGVLFYRGDLFAERIVLDQTWALDAIYAVFHRGRSLPLLRGHGRFTRTDLEALVWQGRSEEEQRLLLDMMKQCSVCFEYRTLASGETEYVAPDLLPTYEEVEDQLFAWKAESAAVWRLEYRFLHQALIRQLMSRIGRGARDNAIYWKYGLWLWDGGRRSQLLVQQGDLEREDEPGAGYLEIQAQGEQPLEVLRAVREIVTEIQIGEEPVETLTVDGENESVTVLDKDWERVQFEKRAGTARVLEEAAGVGESVLGRTGGPLPEGAKKSHEVYVSYAWGDESTAGRIRGEVIERLCQALEEDGLAVRRDRDVMQAGDRISNFMKQLGRSDHVVAVVSDKYLRSPYCMFELYRIYQRCQGEAEPFLECVVPVILPEVKVGGLKERAHYVEYWQGEASELEALVQRLGGGVGTESWEEVRLVREFAMHVDPMLYFLQDVLMPRKLDVHFEGEFAEVRAVLRRRLGVEN